MIVLEPEIESKETAIALLVEKMQKAGVVSDGKKMLHEVLERERLGSTSIGKGIALPHARTQLVDEIVIALMKLQKGVVFNDDDPEPVRLIFLLGTPITAVAEYLKLLSRLSKTLKNDRIRKDLLTADSGAQIRDIFSHAED
ncbi:PTS sugar transporter subunit IIA [candidate division KSB1 bacterium]|nr:PTS sugar transporter subunit IIA [candidate division KSB1 bacterium]